MVFRYSNSNKMSHYHMPSHAFEDRRKWPISHHKQKKFKAVWAWCEQIHVFCRAAIKMWKNNFSKKKSNWKLLPFQWQVIELRREKEALNFIKEEMLRRPCCLLTCLSMTRGLKQHGSLNEVFQREGVNGVRQLNLPTSSFSSAESPQVCQAEFVLLGTLPLVVTPWWWIARVKRLCRGNRGYVKVRRLCWAL